ncbi:MAG: PIN domain-containing protein, partial [Pseudomonadota bacterium]
RHLKVYAFIDTNIFLDFYRSQNETTLSLLKKLESVKENIICTYQVEMEFLKNRQKLIVEISKESKLDINCGLPAVMHDSNLNLVLQKHKDELDKRKRELKTRVSNIITKPSLYDPIYKSLESIFKSENNHVLKRDMIIRRKIKRLAWRRFMLGCPPRKSSDTSIGDALNWEWFIHCAENYPGKYIIVSRDSDYGISYNDKYHLNDSLKLEFRERVGKKSITYTTKLSEALKMMEVPITRAEEKVENEHNLKKINLIDGLDKENVNEKIQVKIEDIIKHLLLD